MSKNKIHSNAGTKKFNPVANREYIAISFRYLTTKKDYNFDYFGKNLENCREVKAKLLDRIAEISSSTWLDMQNLPKTTGFETLCFDDIRFSPKEYIFSKEEKVYVLRACKDYRIIGFKLGTVYYIIGFDFNYSAYDHGT